PLRRGIIKVVHRLPSRPRTLDDQTSGSAQHIKSPEALHYVAQLRSPLVSNGVQEGQQHHGLVRHRHVHFADKLKESIADAVVFQFWRADGYADLLDAVAVKVEVGPFAQR